MSESRSAGAAVTQDILLVPRTVYMPYVPHVPVAPARLSMAAPAGRVTETEERYRESSRTRELESASSRESDSRSRDAQRDARVVDVLDKCLDEMRKLNGRITDLEARATQRPLPPASGSVPCPPDAVVPGYTVPGFSVPGALPPVPVGPGLPPIENTSGVLTPGPRLRR